MASTLLKDANQKFGVPRSPVLYYNLEEYRMSELNITEYTSVSQGTMGLEPSLSSQTVELRLIPVKCIPFNARASFVRLVASADCRISFGEDPSVSDTDGTILLSGSTEFFAVRQGSGHTLSAVLL